MSRNYEKIIENLTAIIENTPYEGGRIAAQTQLKKILKSIGMTMEELKKKAESESSNERKYRLIKVHRKYADLTSQILNYYTKNILGIFDHGPIQYVRGPDKGKCAIYATEAEAIECQAMYEFYYQAYKKQLEIFWAAFVYRNDLATIPDPKEPKRIGDSNPSPDDYEVAKMMFAMGKAEFPSKQKRDDRLMIGHERKAIKP